MIGIAQTTFVIALIQIYIYMCVCVQVDAAELDMLTKATVVVARMGDLVQQFHADVNADFWHDCDGEVDVSLLDSFLVPFEEVVQKMLSEHSDLFKPKRKRTSSKRPHHAREEQLVENFEKARQSMWTKLHEVWTFRSQVQVDATIDLVEKAL